MCWHGCALHHYLDLFAKFLSRYVNVGLFYLRQLFFAWFDYQIHTSKGKLVADVSLNAGMTLCLDKQDVTALWNDLRERVSLVKGGRRSAGQGSFGHIVGGYDAGYYGWVLEICVSPGTYRRGTGTRTR